MLTSVCQAAGNTLWALAHMGAAHLPPRMWNTLLPLVTRDGRSHPEHLRQAFQARMKAALSTSCSARSARAVCCGQFGDPATFLLTAETPHYARLWKSV